MRPKQVIPNKLEFCYSDCMNTIFLSVVFIHAVIHGLAFSTSLLPAQDRQTIMPVSKIAGLMWLGAAVLFVLTASLYIYDIPSWQMFAIGAIALSQFVLLLSWDKAKFGTIPNIIILAAVLF